jgi:E3 ubiquitin-protein ligase TRIP12
MDFTPAEAQQATASSSTVHPPPPQDPSFHDDSSPSTSTRTLRSSARVKAAKDKGKQKETTPEQVTELGRITRSSAQASKRTRETQNKGKGKQQEDSSVPRATKKFAWSLTLFSSSMTDGPWLSRTRRTTQQQLQPVTAGGLTINEPSRDTKGKKRAIPDPFSDDDNSPTSSSKRTKTASTPYSLRSRGDSSGMPKKSRCVLVTAVAPQSSFLARGAL